jgi:outer membrane protein assembly factor BamB
MKTKLFLIIIMASALTTYAQAQNIQWRGVDRSGNYTESGLLQSWPENGPEMLWHSSGLGEGHTSVAIDDDLLYVTGMTDTKGFIYVFDTKGELVNKAEYGREWSESYNGPRGTISVHDGKLYLVSGLGSIYCFDKSTLKQIWKKDYLKEYDASNIMWGINEAPLIIDNKVIVTPGGKTNNVVALDKNTGSTIWSSPGAGDPSAYCSPVYVGDQQTPQIITMTAEHIIGVDVSNGKTLWSHENKNKYAVHANTPVYSNGMILCTSGYGQGSTMLRLKNGGKEVEQVWFSSEPDNRIGAMVKVGSYVYGSGDNNRFWFCIDWNTGEIKYKERGLAMGNIISNNDMLYCYTDRGDMILAKATPDKFDITGRFNITLGTQQHWAHPVIYKGTLYVRHGDSLMAYKIK